MTCGEGLVRDAIRPELGIIVFRESFLVDARIRIAYPGVNSGDDLHDLSILRSCGSPVLSLHQ